MHYGLIHVICLFYQKYFLLKKIEETKVSCHKNKLDPDQKGGVQGRPNDQVLCCPGGYLLRDKPQHGDLYRAMCAGGTVPFSPFPLLEEQDLKIPQLSKSVLEKPWSYMFNL